MDTGQANGPHVMGQFLPCNAQLVELIDFVRKNEGRILAR